MLMYSPLLCTCVACCVRSVIESKLSMAAKTGVLNISLQGLKLKSTVWKKLSQDCYKEKLKSLDISGNKLVELPAEVVHLPKLKTLIISKCHLTSLPDITNMEVLSSLNACDNALQNDGTCHLPSSLVKLDLSANRFIAFPTELFNLTSLTELNLSNNAIALLDGIGQLVSLVWLVLDDNQITFIPHEIGNLTKLKHVSLKHNCIAKKVDDQQSISSELFTHTSAEEINLEGNKLKREEIMSFEGVEDFIARRKKNKDKLLQGGGLLDLSFFGLE
jgi:Leucine-rich repeat (LRR) protein